MNPIMLNLRAWLLVLVVMITFSSCAMNPYTYKGKETYNKPQFTQQKLIKMSQRPVFFEDLNGAINELANQLLINNVVRQDMRKIVLTSFVSLEKFKETSTFGRVASESLIDELHVRNFRIIDFRGQDNISINEKGEFHITRDIQKLKNRLRQVYILVGTYSKFDQNSIALNSRLLNYETGDVLSTGRVIYKNRDCSLFNTCEESTKMQMVRGN